MVTVFDIKPYHMLTTVYASVDVYKVSNGRNPRFESYPKSFSGLKYIQPNMEYMSNNTVSHLSFKIDNPATVFIAYMVGAGKPPEWLRSFARHSKGAVRVADSDFVYDVFYRSYVASGVVSLPGPSYQSDIARPPYLVFVGSCEILTGAKK